MTKFVTSASEKSADIRLILCAKKAPGKSGGWPFGNKHKGAVWHNRRADFPTFLDRTKWKRNLLFTVKWKVSRRVGSFFFALWKTLQCGQDSRRRATLFCEAHLLEKMFDNIAPSASRFGESIKILFRYFVSFLWGRQPSHRYCNKTK